MLLQFDSLDLLDFASLMTASCESDGKNALERFLNLDSIFNRKLKIGNADLCTVKQKIMDRVL